MSIANINDWTKNVNPPLFQNIYSDGRNTLRYRGGGGYERIYYAVTVPKSYAITFSLKFCSPTGYSCSYGDSQEYIVIFGTQPSSTDSMTSFNILARTPVSGVASTIPVKYSASYTNDTGSDRTVYLGIDWGYIVDGIEVELEYDDIQVETFFNGWILIDDQLTLTNGKLALPVLGGIIEPPYPSSFWNLQSNDILTLNDEYYNYTLQPIVDESIGRDDNAMLTYPYPASFWYYDNKLKRLNMMLLPEEYKDYHPIIHDDSDGSEFFNVNNEFYINALKQLHNCYRIRLEILSDNETVIGEITKDLSITAAGQITINLEQVTRRSCSLSLINVENKYIPTKNSPFWLNRKFRLWLGVVADKDTYWWSQGIFYTVSANATGRILSIEAVDKGGWGSDQITELLGNISHLKETIDQLSK